MAQLWVSFGSYLGLFWVVSWSHWATKKIWWPNLWTFWAIFEQIFGPIEPPIKLDGSTLGLFCQGKYKYIFLFFISLIQNTAQKTMLQYLHSCSWPKWLSSSSWNSSAEKIKSFWDKLIFILKIFNFNGTTTPIEKNAKKTL
jgi:hypothetical protein